MLTAYGFVDKRLRPVPVESAEDLIRPDVVWVDSVEPNEHERALLREVFRLKLDDEEIEDIEDSARCFVDEAGIHLNSFFLHHHHDGAEVVTVSFLLNEGRLLSIRTEELAAFRLFRMRARMQVDFVRTAEDVLLSIYDVAVEYAADVLEGVYADLDKVSRRVLNRNTDMTDSAMADTVADIAAQEDLNGKVRLDLMDTRRSLSFLLRCRVLQQTQEEDLREVLRDLESLNSHTAFLFDKINFLMDAVMGLINLQQNKIIKIFSIAAVVFLPPTVIASIYGMNFGEMPELQWHLGYPFALVLMVLSGIAPYWFFKRKGWL
ncbi:magnesium/cobalt transporter CorA [Silvimonas amylolytica]|uniref:Magnesium transport protein CorA n=1 Tax=Silvimonas amylolytica TaxID=449663 RepID=A0ABQ2PKB5_9NEIS|nr:magnesium/cobalt transporter CorA [Silvimonas amylolytica]GGP25462.1 magnesium transport protein CorA [Silvimonas amylolytica]